MTGPREVTSLGWCAEGRKQDVAFTSRPRSHTLDSESHKTFSFLGRVQGPESFQPETVWAMSLSPGPPQPGHLVGGITRRGAYILQGTPDRVYALKADPTP